MQDDSPNDITVKIYDQKFDSYIDRTPDTYNKSHTPLLRWINTALTMVPVQGKILEIGSGPGRDAQYIIKKNFDLLCSDASQAFVKHLRSKNLPAVQLNIIKDEVNSEYDMVFANAVVPHFTPDDLTVVLNKVNRFLSSRGILAISAKQGHGDAWINEKFHEKRYVHYWQPDELVQQLTLAGFKKVYIDQNIPGDLPTHTWTLIIAQKID